MHCIPNQIYSQTTYDIPDLRHFAGPVCLDPIRNAAPELLNIDNSEKAAAPASDIYAFGMTALEIFTEELPFAHIPGGTSTKDIGRLVRTIASGALPERPEGSIYVERGLDDGMWALLVRCWSSDPKRRPMIDEFID